MTTVIGIVELGYRAGTCPLQASAGRGSPAVQRAISRPPSDAEAAARPS
jgi:hypothetical protein